MSSNFCEIRPVTKHIITLLLITTVLLPLTIQFSHALKKHEHIVSTKAQKALLGTPKTNCAIFHYQINYNTINFSLTFSFSEPLIFNEKIYYLKNQISTPNLYYKSSRAPPIYC